MMAANIAPGLRREFTAEDWPEHFPLTMWDEVRKEAEAQINMDVETNIQGYDIDSRMVEIARENAKRAGVDSLIHFQRRAVKDTSHPKKYGFMITNPPYGERLEDASTLPELYTSWARHMPDWTAGPCFSSPAMQTHRSISDVRRTRTASFTTVC